MKFIDLVKKRYSARNYTKKKVERKIINQCIEAARLAPSACNSQPWKFTIVDEPRKVLAIAKCTHNSIIKFNKFTEKATAFAVITIEPSKTTAKIGAILTSTQYSYIDIGIAAEHFCLQAAELGLGTCMIGWSNHGKVKKILNIPKHKKIALLISIGYDKRGKANSKIRKKKDEMSSYDEFNSK